MRLNPSVTKRTARRLVAAGVFVATLVITPNFSADGLATGGVDGSAGASQPAQRLNPPIDAQRYVRFSGTIPPSTANEPSGAFRFLCSMSHLAKDDPIVFPGQPGVSHLHMFFGNTVTNASSTYQTLRNSGNGSCQGGPLNRSAYWTPALFNAAGQVVVPDTIVMYYKGTNGTAAQLRAIKPLAEGLRLIAGYDMASPATPTHASWNCESSTVKSATIPRCATGRHLLATVTFPQCWDGVNLDSANHRNHLAYVVYGSGPVHCPSTHPVLVPEVTVLLMYTHDGNSNNWYLSSDRMPGMTHANGTTLHADWFGGWDPSTAAEWVRNCINGMRSCSGGQLGDGLDLNPTAPYPGGHLLNPPA